MVLLGLPIVFLIWRLRQRAQDPLRGWRGAMDPELLEAMVMDGRANKPRRGIWLLAAWLLGIITVAGPTFRPEPSPFSDNPSPVMILLKADESMNTEDFMPNRMERAQLKAVDLAKLRNGRPSGLIAYAGSAHLVLPPTRDTDVVATMAQNVSPEIMPEPGNALQSAIALAEETLKETGGSIVVIADSVPEFKSKLPVHVLAVSRTDVNGAVMITADSSDVETLARRTKGNMVAVNADGTTRWAEAGFWLVPILGIFVLLQFRRDSE